MLSKVLAGAKMRRWAFKNFQTKAKINYVPKVIFSKQSKSRYILNIDCHIEFYQKLEAPPLQVRWLLKEKTWEKHKRRTIDLDFQRHKRQYRACAVRRWKQKRHKPCQRSLSLNVRSENEKAEMGVWKWKWTSVTGREKKNPKKDDYISILSGN